MKILVIGEFCIDKFVYGEVRRICPEAPVPVFNSTREVLNPGMGGNVVANIQALRPDAEVLFWHQSENISKKRIVEERSNQMIVRIDEGELHPVSEFGYMTPDRRETIKESDLVIVSDYNKGYLSEMSLLRIAEFAKLVILDSKKRLSFEVAKSFSFVKMNEYESLMNKDIANLENVIVTLGSHGARIGNLSFPQRFPKETIDVSGAGDTFVAAFGIKYLETQNVEESIDYANEMASIVVGKRGVTTP